VLGANRRFVSRWRRLTSLRASKAMVARIATPSPNSTYALLTSASIALKTTFGVSPAFRWSTSAAIPDATPAAMLVPLRRM